MSDPLFRQEVIEAGRQRLSGAVIASVPPSSRPYTVLVLAAGVGIALLLAFGSYAGAEAVRGVVEYDKGASRVYPATAGELRRLHVRSGDRVAAGAPLATVGTAQGPRGLSVQIAEIERQVAELDRQLSLIGAGLETDRTGLEQQRVSLTETIGSLERQRELARAQAALAERAVARSGRLAREGAGTKRQEEDARSQLLTRRADAEALDERLIATRATLAETAQRIARGSIDAQKTRSELVAQRALLGGQADALRRSDSLVVTAPVAGVVADLPFQPGQRVTPQSSLATVAPPGGVLEARLYAPSRAIGFVRPGQQVRLRFDAFPYQKYGAVRGTVATMSPVAVDPAALDPALELKGPVFRITVRLAAVAGLPQVRPGMTLSADLLAERRPLWAVLLGPLREAARR